MKIKALPTKIIELYKLNTTRQQVMDSSTSRSKKECTAFHRQAFLLKNSSKNA
jgi:hypothetical protein